MTADEFAATLEKAASSYRAALETRQREQNGERFPYSDRQRFLSIADLMLSKALRAVNDQRS